MSKQVNPEEARRHALWVVQKLRDAGYQALWAGGCVRDQLVGRKPNDYDVATNATPDEVRGCFGRRRTLAIGAAFGVITVLGRAGQGQVEVATFRSDATYTDGRHPDSVSFSTAREDAQRRDFTMNGLFYDPVEGRVIDHVGGREDLQAGIVRAIGDPHKRIAEDKLRMLRAVRFATTFDFEIDPVTKAAVRHEAAAITAVSAERITVEMRKMLEHPRRSRALDLLREVGLLQAVVPESRVLWEPSGSAHPDAEYATWESVLGILNRLERPPFPVALAGLLWGIRVRSAATECVSRVCNRWRLSNEERNTVAWMLDREDLVRAAESVDWPRLQRVLIGPAVEQLLSLAEAIAAVVDGDQRQIEVCRRKLELPPEVLDPPPLITGNDLRRAGLQPGPSFGRILEGVRDAQLEGRIATREEALEMARRLNLSQEDHG